MIIKLHPFLDKLQHLSYVCYSCERIEKILFITLYGREEMEKYVIIEPISLQDYPGIVTALQTYQQSSAA
jgi:hypothetical protein